MGRDGGDPAAHRLRIEHAQTPQMTEPAEAHHGHPVTRMEAALLSPLKTVRPAHIRGPASSKGMASGIGERAEAGAADLPIRERAPAIIS